MKIFSWQDLVSGNQVTAFFEGKTCGSALAVGAFDGPHIGHQALFDAVCAQKMMHGVVTFSRSPRAHKDADQFEGDVSTLRLRLERFAQLGFDFAVVIDFSYNFSIIHGRDFLVLLHQSLTMRFLAVGPLFRCGYRLDTGEAEIKTFAVENNIGFTVVKEVSLSGERISSTQIRKSAAAGDFETVQKLLGFSYRLDLSDIPCVKTIDGFTCKKNALTQIIPPVGQYAVCVETVQHDSAIAVSRYVSMLIVDDENLCCIVPHVDVAAFVQTIIFGNPEGKNREACASRSSNGTH